MARNRVYVTAYRLEVEANQKNVENMDNFIEAILDFAIVSNECNYVAIIVASSDALDATKLMNMVLKFFGENAIYKIGTLGRLGPFKI